MTPAAVPGPIHRETFYAAQRRHRRRARVLSAICVLPLAVLALLVAALISPWFYLAIAGGLRLLRLAGPLRGPSRDMAAAIHGLLLPVRDWADSRPVREPDVVRSVIGIIVPSVVLLALLWLWIRLRFRVAGTGGTLIQAGARKPNPLDLEEVQLVNLVEEMAIAAGIPAPRVMLIDSEAVNAAVVGSSHKNCTVVVSRRLLATLDRDETQGVLADLVASAGNGDLGIAFAILSVFQTIGLVLAGRDVLLSGLARRTVWRFLSVSVWRGKTPGKRAARAAAASDLMLRSTGTDGLDTAESNTAPGGKTRDKGLGKLGFITVWPFLASAMFRMFMLFYMNFVTGPLLGRIWKTRRYLADATAVQLTRNPDGLGSALVRLGHCNTLIPGSASAAHLFVVGPEAMNHAMSEAIQAFRAQNETRFQELKGLSGQKRLQTLVALQAQVAQQVAANAAAHPELVAAQKEWAAAQTQSIAKELGIHSLHPPLDARLQRLQALGSHYAADSRTAAPGRRGGLLGKTLLVALVVILGGLLAIPFAMIAAFAAMANFMLAIPVLLGASWLVTEALR